ncbi:MAG TPA: DnaJ C-terminal domain-containing protein [Casimicrobiaceae bacterium]|nr:DnaJ C-terminal domain-containing protein [Casimicrobiaceae bacterium]
MKYKDYYKILGLERGASADEIKTAYRRLARKYHPDVSKEKDAEEKFKEMSEAYETLKDPEKRAAYDQLGTHRPGQEFRPPPEWGAQFGEGFGPGAGHFEDIDLSDLFAGLAGRHARGAGRRADRPIPGSDYEAVVRIGFEQAFQGTEVDLELSALEWDADGGVRRVPHRVRTRIPRGVTNGEKLRVPGKGGKGVNGGPDGDLYLDIEVAEHPLYRVAGSDLYVDLPLAPWEAVLGTSVELPTPAGAVTLKVPPGTRAGQQLRLSGRGMTRGSGAAGHLYALVRIEVPSVVDDAQKELYRKLADSSSFDPRAHFSKEAK